MNFLHPLNKILLILYKITKPDSPLRFCNRCCFLVNDGKISVSILNSIIIFKSQMNFLQPSLGNSVESFQNYTQLDSLLFLVNLDKISVSILNSIKVSKSQMNFHNPVYEMLLILFKVAQLDSLLRFYNRYCFLVNDGKTPVSISRISKFNGFFF